MSIEKLENIDTMFLGIGHGPAITCLRNVSLLLLHAVSATGRETYKKVRIFHNVVQKDEKITKF